MSFSNKQRPLDHEEVLLRPVQPLENGHHQYTPVITDPKESPKKGNSVNLVILNTLEFLIYNDH